jgi:hypothetical protein
MLSNPAIAAKTTEMKINILQTKRKDYGTASSLDHSG